MSLKDDFEASLDDEEFSPITVEGIRLAAEAAAHAYWVERRVSRILRDAVKFVEDGDRAQCAAQMEKAARLLLGIPEMDHV